MKKILLAASECVPFIKTGGLADVAGALPKYFDKENYDVRVILPRYMCIPEKYRNQMYWISNFYMYFNGRDRFVGVFRLELNGVTYYFVDNEEYYSGSSPYTDARYDIEKFCFFCKAALAVLPAIGFQPDIIHCNDWHTGLIPVYLKTEFCRDLYYAGMKCMITIHNLKFQGIWNIKDMKQFTGFPDDLFTSDKLEFFGQASMFKGGIVYSDAVTTVSETYSREVMTPFYGEKLDPLLAARSNVFHGIVNGIDTEIFDPANDPLIWKAYDASNFRTNKKHNKQELQKQMGLNVDPHKMLVGIVSRLTDQKGFDLVARVFEEMLYEDLQFVILGTGDHKYEDMFRYFAGRYPDRVAACITYSEEVSHRIYAGTDAFLMPSLFEPCGLSQLIALRYGSVPIVRETGGLKDTVQPYNEIENTGTGFSFANYNAHEMMATIRRAEDVFRNDKRRFNQIVERGMNMDFSWHASARKYEALYDQICGY